MSHVACQSFVDEGSSFVTISS